MVGLEMFFSFFRHFFRLALGAFWVVFLRYLVGTSTRITRRPFRLGRNGRAVEQVSRRARERGLGGGGGFVLDFWGKTSGWLAI